MAPEMVRRLAWILAGLASVVARRFLREPRFAGLILPLWGWLGRSARRFERAVGRPARVRAVQARREVPVAAPVARARLPGGRGWLVRALGYEAAGYGSQLQALLAEPEMQAIVASVPAVGRILRPLCRILGVVPVGAEPVLAPKPERAPRPARVKRKRVRAVLIVSPLSGRPLPRFGTGPPRRKLG